jgi:adenosylcobinamide-phosphate synthase
MTIATTVSVLVLALGLEAAFGYPKAIYRRIGHPATWLGALLSTFDNALNRAQQSAGLRRAAGVLTLVIIVAIPAGIAWFIERALVSDWAGNLVLAVLASTLLASRSLYVHVRDVAGALETGSIIAARSAVSRIVGRDPQVLDEHGVARAAIESLAENASDGVLAPAFWFLVLGLPGLAAYKAINTADSMIGHRNLRHEAFGWAAARFDDLLNLLPSRLTGLLFAAAALVVPGTSARAAVQAMARDASRHRSPNAGWPESAMAGALGLKLNGPKNYVGVLVSDAYMGDGRREATAQDIRDALRLASTAWAIMVATLLITAVILRT